MDIVLGLKLQVGEGDKCFDDYPDLSLEAWHRKHGVYVE